VRRRQERAGKRGVWAVRFRTWQTSRGNACLSGRKRRVELRWGRFAACNRGSVDKNKGRQSYKGRRDSWRGLHTRGAFEQDDAAGVGN
jgi:hypothetical protein